MMLSEMLHSFMVTKRGWTQQIFLCFMVSAHVRFSKLGRRRPSSTSGNSLTVGTCSLVTVRQPPALTAALGHDVILPCNLSLSHGERMQTPPVLYWFYLSQNITDPPKLWSPTEKYAVRVKRLDNNLNASDMSIRLKNVQWADSGKYQCKVSVNTNQGSFRKNGDGTLLTLYDTIIFDLISHSDSLLRCEVNVTQDPGFVLSIFHDGHKLQPVDCAPGDAKPTMHYVTIFETISLKEEGEYECQLHLNKDLVTKSIFQYHLPGAEDGADAEKNASVTWATAVPEPSLGPFPEPWFLYGALLLVPGLTLLALLTAMLIYRC